MKKRPTIAELEAILEERDVKVGVLPNGKELEIKQLQLALAFWIGVAFTNGAVIPDDLTEWSVDMLAGERRTAVQVTREALGLVE